MLKNTKARRQHRLAKTLLGESKRIYAEALATKDPVERASLFAAAQQVATRAKTESDASAHRILS